MAVVPVLAETLAVVGRDHDRGSRSNGCLPTHAMNATDPAIGVEHFAIVAIAQVLAEVGAVVVLDVLE